jgi:hypothetical protein
VLAGVLAVALARVREFRCVGLMVSTRPLTMPYLLNGKAASLILTAWLTSTHSASSLVTQTSVLTPTSSARAEREDLEDCAGILAVQCAHYQSKFGNLPMSETMEVLNSETMKDEQAKWIAYGFEMVVGVLTVLEQEHPKH